MAPVLALAAPPSPPAAPTPAPADDALKTSFEALPLADRQAIQQALIWVAGYNNAVSGGFGPKTREALLAFAKEAGVAPAAVLEAAGKARLLAAGKAAADAVGFAPLRDKRAGLELALPQKILTKTTAADAGTRYASGDGTVVVDTVSRMAGTGGLSDLFERVSTPAPPRTITYKFSKPDFFVVTGEAGDRKFYTRYAIEPAQDGLSDPARKIRGFTLTYPKADAKRMDKITIAMAAAFDPFPDAATPSGSPQGAAAAQPQAGAGLSGQAVAVAPGLALMGSPPDRCASPQVDGAPATIKASDPASGLALLAVSAHGIEVAAVAGEDAPGPYFTLFKQADGLAVAPAVFGRNAAGPLVSTPAQQGADGAPVVDRSGALVGVLRRPSRPPPVIAGTTLAADYGLTGSAEIRAFLARAGVTPSPGAAAPAASLGEIVSPWRARVLTVTCPASAK